MAENSGIEWTDHTFNPWIGCQRVSSGCDHCYAETLTVRMGWTEWGPHGVRRRTSEALWRKPIAWNRQAEARRRPFRVFCASLADVFDNQAPEGAREDLWRLVRSTKWLQWQLLTKRPENMARMLPRDWGAEGWPHVWLGVSCENQEAYDRRWPILAKTPAAVRFISYEPALGPLAPWAMTIPTDFDPDFEVHRNPDWIIVGGESGPGARPPEARWIEYVISHSERAGIPVFMKQWGSYRANPLVSDGLMTLAQAREADPDGKGGCKVRGDVIRQFPIAPEPTPDLEIMR